MRDLTAATLIADVEEGIPVTYATFVGYDEGRLNQLSLSQAG
ncbi:MAG TPA: hypothetical protein VNY35_10010 [Solirubrobacteraceae bacterium]|nr:hypothetical protein [Solirubrobacteraceae bacterium]